MVLLPSIGDGEVFGFGGVDASAFPSILYAHHLSRHLPPAMVYAFLDFVMERVAG
jgi:hypothetical protein